MPVVRVTNSRGFAPTRFCHTSHNKSVSGTSALMKRTTFAKRVSFTAQIISTTEDTEERQNMNKTSIRLAPSVFFSYFVLGFPLCPLWLIYSSISNSLSNPFRHTRAQLVRRNH